MNPLAVIVRPRSTITALAMTPRLRHGFAVVLVSGLVSAGIGIVAAALAGGGLSGVVASALLPVLFVAYWLIEGWLVDAGAGMLGRSGRRGTFLAVSGYVFVPWVAYALLSLAEAGATHSGGSGSALASTLGWLTLPVLSWFLALTVLAIRAVYDIPALNALALALLPYAAIAAAVLLLTIALAGVHRS